MIVETYLGGGEQGGVGLERDGEERGGEEHKVQGDKEQGCRGLGSSHMGEGQGCREQVHKGQGGGERGDGGHGEVRGVGGRPQHQPLTWPQPRRSKRE